MLQAVYRIDPANTGDMASAPLQYLSPPPACTEIDVHTPGLLNPRRPLIFGGGGTAKYATRFHACTSLRVMWGAGLNQPCRRTRDRYPRCLSSWDLVGVRDWGRGFQWVPCASCLSEAFDAQYEITRAAVVYEGSALGLPFPRRHCREGRTLHDVLAFLGSAETVITSSYHGLYWATLLGRRVAVIPNQHASKFYHFRWPVLLVERDDWREGLARARAAPEALAQSRAANRRFAAQVMEWIPLGKLSLSH